MVGNLPYNISNKLLFYLLRNVSLIDDMHFMLQKEVADRLAASVGESPYSSLSVMVNYYCKVKKLFNVPSWAFSPSPKVMSTVLRIIPHRTLPYEAKNISLFDSIVKLSFSQRRKNDS